MVRSLNVGRSFLDKINAIIYLTAVVAMLVACLGFNVLTVAVITLAAVS